MSAAAFALLGAALLLFSLATWLTPCLAVLAFALRKRSAPPCPPVLKARSLDILIPARREPVLLPATLRSVRAAAEESRLTTRVLVSLNDWPGPAAARAALGADLVVSSATPGKWEAIAGLVRESRADWIALVDAGTSWPASFLRELEPQLERAGVVALNPRYVPRGASLAARFYWWLEANLKRAENWAGGPVSFHGATMFFRGPELRALFAARGGEAWLNDDVALPVLARLAHPELKTKYIYNLRVEDLGHAESGRGLAPAATRRKRLLLGNLQWMSALYGEAWRRQPAVALLATRRVARLGWAWALAALLASGVCFVEAKIPSFPWLANGAAAAGLCLLFARSLRPFGAFWLLCLTGPLRWLYARQSFGPAEWK